MDYSWLVKYVTEFIGTALLIILGNGAVANVELKGTKAHGQSWLIIAWGYGLGVMLPVVALGAVSSQINPAFTLGLAVSGLFPWAQVVPYIIAQVLGAMVGQLIVVAVYQPFYKQTENPNAILGTFSTIAAIDKHDDTNHPTAWLNGFLNEFVGSFVLFFGAMGLTTLAVNVKDAATGTIGGVVLGFLVLVLVASLGGPTGPGLNPARDFGPRLVHALLPKSVLGEHKGSSKWWYAWVPSISPILAAIAAVALFKLIYLGK
ncbi:MAG: aquaporin family protein [Streptococcaceae bacterium]|jgi:glycerol uptake facilitator protein|nr:aquaporin family protein [Streptococcaceae bacterium]